MKTVMMNVDVTKNCVEMPYISDCESTIASHSDRIDRRSEDREPDDRNFDQLRFNPFPALLRTQHPTPRSFACIDRYGQND